MEPQSYNQSEELSVWQVTIQRCFYVAPLCSFALFSSVKQGSEAAYYFHAEHIHLLDEDYLLGRHSSVKDTWKEW